MAWRRICGTTVFTIVASILVSTSSAQQGNGVVVDPQGVLRTHVVRDPGGQLTRARINAARKSLPAELARPSKQRMISLTRLERIAGERLATGQGLTDDMKFLAGLTRIEHVFLYPETGDVVIAGPAEGYVPNVAGRMVGMHTGRAVLELQDLVVALRAYPPNGQPTPVLRVSIDPTPEGLSKMRQFLINIQGRVTPNDARRIAAGLKENLGLQNVLIDGVSRKTHFAQVMLEADYRMKLIGIGLEQPKVNIRSYVSRANPADVSRNALQRWYFTPDYDCVMVSEDDLAMRLQGDGVKLVGEDQLVQAGGARVVTGRVNRASNTFVQEFTRKYSELSKAEPVYAQLRNLIDMAITAAFLQQYDYYGQANWNLDVFGHEERFAVEVYPEPKQVETAVNAIWKGNTLMTPVGGGVNIQPTQALRSDRLDIDTEGELAGSRDQVNLQGLQADQWWWD